MKGRGFNAAAGVSLLLFAATAIAWWASHLAGIHWVYYCTYSRAPVLVDGSIEFGNVGKAEPINGANLQPNSSWGRPIYMRYTSNLASKALPPDTEDNYARVVRWNLGGIRMVNGRVIPPWAFGAIPPFGALPAVAISYTMYDVPILYPQVLFGLLPAVWFLRFVRSLRSVPPGICEGCGYDLRATPERCPECGAVANPGGISVP